MPVISRALVRSSFSSIAIIVGATTASASPVRGIVTTTTRPVAPRGGIMQLQLAAGQPGTNWPATLPVELSDGTVVDGVVAWLHRAPADPAAPRRWTSDVSGLDVRAINPSDDSRARNAGSPVLFVPLPTDASGPIRFAGRTLTPRWLDLPPLSTGPNLLIEDRPDRPDPDAPLEFWRWVLLAERLGMSPPAPPFDRTAALAARHYADLWRAGLARLAGESPGVADACSARLTRIALDGDRPFAAWEARPPELARLLSVLTETDRPGRMLTTALHWADMRPPLIAWLEAISGPAIEVAVVNQDGAPVVARLNWELPGDVPIAVELPPGELCGVRLQRPAPPEPGPGPVGRPAVVAETVLVITAGRQTIRLPVAPDRIDARPPGVLLGPLRPPLGLAELQTGRQRPVAADRATSAQVRRREGAWEVFFDCRRPAGSEPAAAGEAVELLLGPASTPIAVLRVPERGPYRMIMGSAPPGLEVARRSHADRWYARVVLPPAWAAWEDPSRPLRLAVRRRHGDSTAAETAPFTGPPWRETTGRAVVGLSAWGD